MKYFCKYYFELSRTNIYTKDEINAFIEAEYKTFMNKVTKDFEHPPLEQLEDLTRDTLENERFLALKKALNKDIPLGICQTISSFEGPVKCLIPMSTYRIQIYCMLQEWIKQLEHSKIEIREYKRRYAAYEKSTIEFQNSEKENLTKKEKLKKEIKQEMKILVRDFYEQNLEEIVNLQTKMKKIVLNAENTAPLMKKVFHLHDQRLRQKFEIFYPEAPRKPSKPCCLGGIAENVHGKLEWKKVYQELILDCFSNDCCVLGGMISIGEIEYYHRYTTIKIQLPFPTNAQENKHIRHLKQYERQIKFN